MRFWIFTGNWNMFRNKPETCFVFEIASLVILWYFPDVTSYRFVLVTQISQIWIYLVEIVFVLHCCCCWDYFIRLPSCQEWLSERLFFRLRQNISPVSHWDRLAATVGHTINQSQLVPQKRQCCLFGPFHCRQLRRTCYSRLLFASQTEGRCCSNCIFSGAGHQE